MTQTKDDQEIIMREDEVIVSKTDLKGRITYTNHIFRNISGFTEEELLNQPHNVIRHPDMPRCIFKLLWDKLEANEEIFAYVKNICKDGQYYWVFAHVTPSFNEAGEKIGYHSNRRKPDEQGLEIIKKLYQRLVEIEASVPNSKVGMTMAFDFLKEHLASAEMPYDQFIFDFTRSLDRSFFEQNFSPLKLAS